jgi:hypothetical protein
MLCKVEPSEALSAVATSAFVISIIVVSIALGCFVIAPFLRFMRKAGWSHAWGRAVRSRHARDVDVQR